MSQRVIVIDPETKDLFLGTYRHIPYFAGFACFDDNDVTTFRSEADARDVMARLRHPLKPADAYVYHPVEFDDEDGYMRAPHLRAQGFDAFLDGLDAFDGVGIA